MAIGNIAAYNSTYAQQSSTQSVRTGNIERTPAPKVSDAKPAAEFEPSKSGHSVSAKSIDPVSISPEAIALSKGEA
jgi:hypothetical protein